MISIICVSGKVAASMDIIDGEDASATTSTVSLQPVRSKKTMIVKVRKCHHSLSGALLAPAFLTL